MPRQHIAVFSIPDQLADAKAAWLRPASELIREFLIATIRPSVVYIPYLTVTQPHNVVTSIGRLPQADIPTATMLDDLSDLLASETALPNQGKG